MTIETTTISNSNDTIHVMENGNSSALQGTSKDMLEPIAIIGYSLGFPQDVTSSDAFWETMMKKRNTATEFPKERMNINSIYHPDSNRRGQIPLNRSHFMKADLAGFDAPFFATSTTDAASMDPQQRYLLEYTYKALENSGLSMEAVSGSKTSVYTGVFSSDWMHLSFKDGEQCSTSTSLGVQACFNANRVSWFFNFTGNSANIDTACSSSLVSLDLGCQGLRSGDEDMSIVAGCNIILSPDNMHSLTNLNMLSPDGQCYSFDHRGNGYSRGEGFAVLVLKRVSDAIRDNDTIRGIIRSSGCNQDGFTPSITLPNPISQEALIRQTYKKAGLSMEPTRFFEAHGTGTSVGDPNEAKALGSSFRQVRTTQDPLWVGALKSNLGHLEGASGIAGVIKALLVLEKAVIPPNTNFEKVNPKIDTDFLKIQFPLEPMPWPSKGLRRASVNSFGNAGTNAHVVLDDVYHFLEDRGLHANHLTVRDPPQQAVLEPTALQLPMPERESSTINGDHEPERPKILVLSANDEHGIQRQAKEFASYFSNSQAPLDSRYLDNLSYTLSFRRTSLPWKSYAVVKSVDDLSHLDKILSTAQKSVSSPDIAFIFTGQGAQWTGMGRELFSIARFQESLQTSEKFLLQLGSSWLLREEILRTEDSRINTPELSQPVCTALQIALLDMLSDFNIHPVAVIGHSSGEIAAAYSTGAISAESALKLAYYRGTLSGSLPSQTQIKGTMMSVGLSETDVQPYIDTVAKHFGRYDLTVACINSPKNVTISGGAEQISILQELLDKERIFARKLKVGVAYHSPHMLPAAELYSKAIQGIKPGIAPRHPVAMISSVTGERVLEKDLTSPGYWVSNMVSPVKFLKALDTLLSKSGKRESKKLDLSHRNHFRIDMLVEIGPHSALRAPINDTMLSFRTAKKINYASLLLRDNSAIDSSFNAIGEIACLGYNVDMERLNNLRSNCQKHYQVLSDLPEYVFDHSHKYWDESRISAQYRLGEQGKLDLLGKPVPDWNPMEARWRNHLRVSEMPWIEEHAINGNLIYPGAGMLVMVIEAANQVTKAHDSVVGFEVKNVSYVKPLDISRDPVGVETQLVLHMAQDSSRPLETWSEFRLFAYEQSAWRECCHGHVRVRYAQIPNEVEDKTESQQELEACRETDNSYRRNCTIPFEPSKFYGKLISNGLDSGPAFHRVTGGFYDDASSVIGTISPFVWPEEEYPQPHVIHPTTLDAIFHVAMAGLSKGGEEATPTMIPTFLRNIYVQKTGLSYTETNEISECAWLSTNNDLFSEFGGIVLTDSKDAVLVQFDDLRLTKIAAITEDSSSNQSEAHQLTYHIEYKPDPTLLDAERIQAFCQLDSTSSQTEFDRYIDLIAHQDGGLNILEIDIGARTLTRDTLQMLSVYDTDGDIVYTRYSSFKLVTSLEAERTKAENELRGFSATEFGLLNLQNDAEDQGLEPGFYDIILASKQDQNFEAVLRIARKFLKPKGILVLHETIDSVNNTPQLTNGALVDVFEKNGFTSSDLRLACGPQSIVHIHRIQEESAAPAAVDKPVILILDPASSIQSQVADTIRNNLYNRGIGSVSTSSLEHAIDSPQLPSALFIVLLEVDQTFLYSIKEASYNVLQRFFISAHDVLWMTFAGGTTAGKPEYGVIHGLARALRNEYQELNLTVLSLDAEEQLSSPQMETVAQVIFRNHIRNSAENITDVELLEIDGTLHIPRVVPATHVSTELHKRSVSQHSDVTLIRDAPPLALAVGSPGLLDTLHFVEDEIYSSPLLPDDVEIQTHVIGMNFKDCLIAMGRIANANIGGECAGVVTRAGSETGFQPGDRVVLAASGTFKTFVRGKAWGTFKIPDHLPFTAAATIPCQFGTAWHVIHRLARLQRGESILIHSAAGGTGQALIQVAQNIGAIVYVTVGYQHKKKLLMDTYHIPENHIFYSRSTNFAKSIRRITNGRGVDVVINSLVGDGLIASWECIAANGRFVEIGKKDILADSNLPMYGFRQNVAFFGFDGSYWLQDEPDHARKDIEHLVDLFANGTLRTPQALHTYDILEIEKVFRLVQDGEFSGKIVLQVTPESQVPTVLRTKPSFQVDANATFVIAGGLGGIGRATARWMADRGAKNLVLLSRFGPRTDSARELIKELQANEVRVETPSCDVTDLERMKEVFAKLSADMPPIKGVMQMSVITHDCLFQDLDYHRWKTAVDCKTVGSWNLHSVLPQGMDFFIILASASGLAGIRGQTNYDAGNTYEDALARYRVAIGEKATALDLGAMVDDGILAENPELLNRVLTYGTLDGITRQKFYGILDYYCNPNMPVLSPAESQVAIGLGMGGGNGLESVDYSRQPMLQPLMLAGARQASAHSANENNGGNMTVKEEFTATKSLDDAAEVVAGAIIQKLAKSLVVMQDASSVDYHKPLQMYGVDSLLAIELRNWIVKELKADIAVFETQGASTLSTLSMLVAGRSTIKHHNWTDTEENTTK